MNRFLDCLPFILKQEGGYVDNPSDRGKATNQGITQDTYSRWLTSRGYPAQPVKFMTVDERDEIYLSSYWDAAKCDNYLPPLDLVMFDAWVQHRPGVAAKFLQNAIGVEPDGIIGVNTLNTTRNVDARLVARTVIGLREQFYRGLVEKDVSQRIFLNGWLNRMKALRAEIDKME